MITFFNKNILLTGAKGVSRTLALALAKERANIGIVHYNKHEITELERELGNLRVRNYGYKADLSNFEEIRLATSLYKRQFEMADVIVINIDLHEGKDLLDITAEELDRELRFNVDGTITVVKNFLPEMVKKQEGAILFVVNTSRSISPVGNAALGAIERFSASMNSFFAANGLKKIHTTVAYVSDAGKPLMAETLIKALGKEKHIVKL